jgi:putative SOS response-associated peptidase YedK
MCGRYDNLIASDAYRGLFKANRLPKSNFPLRYNIAPTDQIPIVRIDPRDGEREVVMARWGLIPFWMKEKPKVPHINARAETVDRLPLFREAFAKRRCLIPATGFYEWQQREDGKQPYRFRRKDLEPFAFAGIWEFARLAGEEVLSAAMIVGEPNRRNASASMLSYTSAIVAACMPDGSSGDADSTNSSSTWAGRSAARKGPGGV